MSSQICFRPNPPWEIILVLALVPLLLLCDTDLVEIHTRTPVSRAASLAYTHSKNSATVAPTVCPSKVSQGYSTVPAVVRCQVRVCHRRSVCHRTLCAQEQAL